jgi:hypothetical protein
MQQKPGHLRLNQQNKSFGNVDIKKAFKNLLDKIHVQREDITSSQYTLAIIGCSQIMKNILETHVTRVQIHPLKNHSHLKDRGKKRIGS